MKFAQIDPANTRIVRVEGARPQDVYPWPKGTHIDHGWVGPGVSIIVPEFSTVDGNGPWFSITGKLFGGPAVLFGHDSAGDTVDLPEYLPFAVMFHRTRSETDAYIRMGLIDRPRVAINGETVWEWKL